MITNDVVLWLLQEKLAYMLLKIDCERVSHLQELYNQELQMDILPIVTLWPGAD